MLDALKNFLARLNWPIFGAMVGLMAISILAIRMAEGVEAGLAGNSARQTIFAAIGLGGFLLAMLIPYGRIGRWSYALFGFTLVLLCVVFAFPAQREAQRWIYIPGAEVINFQPSELAKLTFIIALAWYLRYRDSYRRLLGLIWPFMITLVPLVLILMEPDLGTSILLLPTLMMMLFLAGARLRHLAVVVGLGALVVFTPIPRPVEMVPFEQQLSAERFGVRRLGPVRLFRIRKPAGQTLPDWKHVPQVPVAYARLQWGAGQAYDLVPLSLRGMGAMGKDYQVRRIEGWLRTDDPRVRNDTGYQQHQSIIILGAGRLWGQARAGDLPDYFPSLPDDHTDFIFSIIGGQWGFVGCGAVLGLYVVIFVAGLGVASSTNDPFGRLLAVGVLALLAAQIFINIGMTLGLMPVTGMTLPLVSYGGSSLLVNCMALGLLVNVGSNQAVSLAPRPFEFGASRPEDQTRILPALPQFSGRR